MTVQLSKLRVELDAAAYEAGAGRKVAADGKMVASDERRAATMAKAAVLQAEMTAMMAAAEPQGAKIVAMIDRQTAATQDLATQMASLNRTMNAGAAANDNATQSAERSSLAAKAMSHIAQEAAQTAAKSALRHAASSAAATAAGTALAAVLSRVAVGLGLIYVAYRTVKAVIDSASEAWKLGGERIAAYVTIAEKAAAVDLATDYFQRITKSAGAAKLPVDDLTSALTRLREVSSDKLSGSDLQNLLDKHLKAGNFKGNAGVADLAGANTTEEKFRAITKLIDEAMTKGQRLAALDIAGTAFGPALTENLRKNSDYLKDMVSRADKIAATELVSAGDIGRAIELQSRYDAAVKILEQRWHPIQGLLTALGVQMHATWVSIVETIASGVDWVTRLIEKLLTFPYWEKIKDMAAIYHTGYRQPEGPAYASPEQNAAAANEQAVNKLRAGLQNLNAVQAAGAQSLAVYDAVIKDTSKSLDDQKKATDAARTALSAAMDGIEKYIQTTNAAARSVDAGVQEQEKAKTIATLTAAAMRDGKTDLQQYAAEWEALGNRAGDAARSLALARVQSQIKFDSETIGMAQEDVQIASQLRKLYPDIATALGSTEAAAMRTNNQLRAMHEVGVGFAKDFVSGLQRGQSVMAAMPGSCTSMVSKLAATDRKEVADPAPSSVVPLKKAA